MALEPQVRDEPRVIDTLPTAEAGGPNRCSYPTQATVVGYVYGNAAMLAGTDTEGRAATFTLRPPLRPRPFR